MEWEPVNSSWVASVGYDEETRVLSIRVIGGGGYYRYLDVPREVYEQLVAAPSKGRFLNAVIKPNYAGERIP